MVEEILVENIIKPIQSSFFAPVIMVQKKERSCCMFSNYRELNKITIKAKFHIPAIDELLDELHGATYFTNLDPH